MNLTFPGIKQSSLVDWTYMGIHIPCTNNKADTRMVIRLTKSVITFGNLDFVVPKPLLTAVALDSEKRENFGLRISSQVMAADPLKLDDTELQQQA